MPCQISKEPTCRAFSWDIHSHPRAKGEWPHSGLLTVHFQVHGLSTSPLAQPYK